MNFNWIVKLHCKGTAFLNLQEFVAGLHSTIYLLDN